MKLHRRDLVKVLGVAGAFPVSSAAQGPQAPRFFDGTEYELLRKLCDMIVPGAIEGRAPEFIDLLTSENKEYQRQVRGGLTWLNAACRDRFGKEFLSCSGAQQKEVLDLIAFRRNAEADPSLRQGIAFFSFLRDLTLDGYFTSRDGIQYLEFRGNGAVSEFPGCPKPEELP